MIASWIGELSSNLLKVNFLYQKSRLRKALNELSTKTLPEGFVVEHRRRYFVGELSVLHFSSAAAAAAKLFSPLLFFRPPVATARVEVAASTESAMSVSSS